MATNIISPPLALTAYQQLINGAKWCVFWLTAEDRLGITDGKTRLYETTLNTTERMTLTGVAESLLPARWRMIFDKRGFTVILDPDENAETVEIKYIRNGVTLQKADLATTTDRIAQLLETSIAQMSQVSKKLMDIETERQVAALEIQNARRKGTGVAIPAKTRRTRAPAMGLQFND
uniref:DUF1828 domain-containing protein n=1 Tax=Panagrellus redivivus TaxID=6233 RepID=A0A7E4W1D9_PANRE